jgi:hypothetical protein
MILPSINVSATGPTFINDIPFDYLYNNLTHSYATLPNGKLVTAFVSGLQGAGNYGGRDIINIKVYNIDGTLYGSNDYTYSATSFFGTVGVYVVSDTTVYIYGVYSYLSSTVKFDFAIVKFNPATLTASTVAVYGGNFGLSNYYLGNCFVSTMLTYNNKYYFMVSLDAHATSNNNIAYVGLIEYTPDVSATFTFLYGDSSSTLKTGPVNWFISSTSTSTAYAMYTTGSITNLNYYTISLSGKTSTFIASCFAGGYSMTWVDSSHSKFIGGGQVVNGTDQYLYFNWIQASQDAQPLGIYTFVSDRMWFNGTITAAHFQVHMGYTEHFTTWGSNICWVYGYELNKSTIYFYYPFNSLPGPHSQILIDRIKMSATNWFDSVNYGWTSTVDYPNIDNIPRPDPMIAVDTFQSPIDFNFLSQFAIGLCVMSPNSQIQVYYGLSNSVGTYLATVSYSPADTPNLHTNTQYTFTLTATVYSLPTSGLQVKLLINDREQSDKITNSQGKVVCLITFPAVGYYSFTWEIYDTQNNVSIIQYTVYGAYYVTPLTGGNPPPESVVTAWGNLLLIWVPVLGFVVAPMLGLAIVGGKYAGGTGMVIGMLGGGFGGVVGGTQLNILPGYYLWLYLLFMGIALALAISIGRGGGGEQ